MHWVVEPDWRGDTVVIVAGGPSVTLSQVRAIGLARAGASIKVVAINDAIYPCWFADIGYACDTAWWRHHGGLPGFAGRRVSLDDCGIDGVDFLINTGTQGFDPAPGCLRSGGNSGYQALHLCAHLGADRVVLIGFDMRGSHWFGEHPPAIRRIAPNMRNRIERFHELGAVLAARGIDVVNATPGSALTGFRVGDLELELSRSTK